MKLLDTALVIKDTGSDGATGQASETATDAARILLPGANLARDNDLLAPGIKHLPVCGASSP